MKRFRILYLLIVISSTVVSQEKLTLQEAIKIAIEKNYDVRIAKNNTSVSEIEQSILNSGFLPRISLSSGVNYSNENQGVTFSDGNSTNVNGAVTESYNAALNAEYTIFDGLERKYNNLKNKENFNLSKIQERQTIENTIVSIYQMYYDVAFQTQVVENLALNIQNSKKRLSRTQSNRKFGQGTKLDELNARVDFNKDSINYRSSLRDLNNLKRKLNLLIGREVNKSYRIDTLVIFSKILPKDQVLSNAKENNITSLLRKQNLLISDLDLEINKARFLPKVTGSAGYSWVESQNPPTSFALNNNSYGVSLGINLTWNIFDGGKTKLQKKTAKIRKNNREIELKLAEEELELEVLNAYEDYQNKYFEMSSEKQNVKLNEMNFAKTQKQFNLGQVTSLDYRQAQINYLNTLNNYARAKYDLKIAEITIRQLSGQLIE